MAEGKKLDADKPRWDLLPWKATAAIVDVMTYGAKKYAPDNWKVVPDARRRYFAALQRHLVAWWHGERLDPESGLHHLAHAGCCLVFLLTTDIEENEQCDSKTSETGSSSTVSSGTVSSTR